MLILLFISGFIVISLVLYWAGKPATGKQLDITGGVPGSYIHSGEFDRDWKRSKE